MHRYEELEKLYYKKKYAKLVKFFILSLIFVVIIIVVFKNQTSNQKKLNYHKIEKKELNKTKNNVVKQIKIQSKNNSKNIQKQVKKLTLYPIFPDVSKITKIEASNNLEKNETKKIEKKEIIKEKPQKTEIKIIVKQQKETLSSLIKLYKIDPKYHTAMKIAYTYFDKKDYLNSIKWAKIANKIEPENDESWYLFSKSLLQLGNRKKAKEVLVVYLNTYGTSEKIEKLLRSIK